VDLDCILSQTLVVKGVAVFREIDVLKRTDNEADVLRQDKRVTGKARRLSCRIGRVEDL
jgi:hypothetical protein